MKIRQIQDIAAATLFAIATAGLGGAEGTKEQASALLARLRGALGGEAKLTAVKSLSLEADMRRVLAGEGSEPGPEMAGEIAFDLGDPTHYLYVDSFSPIAGMPPVSIGSALDGDTQWAGPVSATPGGMMIRAGGGNDPAALRTRLEKDLTRLSVALLAGSNIPGVTFTYGGTAESPDGKAEVLLVKGPGGFDGKLFLDEKTALPLMLVYQEVPRRMAVRRQGPGAQAPSEAGHMNVAGAGAAPQAPELKEARMFLSDYKMENGIALPRSITIKIEDGQTEEWDVQKIKINPTFGADHFKKR